MKRKKTQKFTPRPAPAPSSTLPPQRILPPDRYVMRIRLQHCDCCATTHRWTELWAETTIFSPTGGETKSLQRIAQPSFNLPFRISTSELETIPFCHACSDADIRNTLSQLPSPPKPNYQRPLFYLTETQAAEREELRAERAELRSQRTSRATLDDLNQL